MVTEYTVMDSEESKRIIQSVDGIIEYVRLYGQLAVIYVFIQMFMCNEVSGGGALFGFALEVNRPDRIRRFTAQVWRKDAEGEGC